MNLFDKRLELLEAFVIAVKQKNNNDINEELDFVESPNNSYANELISKIDLNKYQELTQYIYDISDCSYYTNLFLYFDDDFNFNDKCKLKAFDKKDVEEFANLVKKIYENENLKELFYKFSLFLSNIENDYLNNYNFDLIKVIII